MLERAVLQQPGEQQVAHLEQRQILVVFDLPGRQQPGGLEIEQGRGHHQKRRRLLQVQLRADLAVTRAGGEEAVRRALGFFAGERSGLESSLDGRPTVAFNLMTLSVVCGTELMPDLSGHVVMVEEVSEHLYAIDRLFFHVTQRLKDAGLAGLKLGRITDVPQNDRHFGAEAEDIAQEWCARSGIAYLGRADIGHDPANKLRALELAQDYSTALYTGVFYRNPNPPETYDQHIRARQKELMTPAVAQS